MSQIVALRNEVMELGERVRSIEAQKLEVESEMHQLRDQISQKRAEGERELRKKDRMEKEMRDLRALLDERALDLKQKQLAVQQAEEQAQRIEMLLKEQKTTTEKVQREYNSQTQKMEKIQRELDEQLHANTQLMADCSQKQARAAGGESLRFWFCAARPTRRAWPEGCGGSRPRAKASLARLLAHSSLPLPPYSPAHPLHFRWRSRSRRTRSTGSAARRSASTSCARPR